MRRVLLLSCFATALSRLGAQTTTLGPARDTVGYDSLAVRLVVSIAQRRLWVIDTLGDTLRVVRVAVGSGRQMQFGTQRWSFATPRGERRVVAKEADPVWIPPDWHYVELAAKRGLTIVRLERGKPLTIDAGRSLAAIGESVFIVRADSTRQLVIADPIVFGKNLYIPPIGSTNRRAVGTLGKFRLDLGGSIGLHGTSEPESIGRAVTHGCIRAGDDDMEWLYRHIAVGAKVTIR